MSGRVLARLLFEVPCIGMGLIDGVTFSRYLSTLQIERQFEHFLLIMLRYTTHRPLWICTLAVFCGLTSCQLVVWAIRGTNM